MTRFEFYAKAAIISIICAITIYSKNEKESMMFTLNFTIGILWGACFWRDFDLLPDFCRRFVANRFLKTEANTSDQRAASAPTESRC